MSAQHNKYAPYYAEDVYFAAFAMTRGAELWNLRETWKDGRTWFLFEFDPTNMGEVLKEWNHPNNTINTREYLSNLKFLRVRMNQARGQ